jgi:hypothetical protein
VAPMRRALALVALVCASRRGGAFVASATRSWGRNMAACAAAGVQAPYTESCEWIGPCALRWHATGDPWLHVSSVP